MLQPVLDDAPTSARRRSNSARRRSSCAALMSISPQVQVAFMEHVQSHEYRENQEHMRRDTPRKAPASHPMLRLQQYASLSASLGSASR